MLDLEQKPSVDETMFEISNSLPILFTKFCLLTYNIYRCFKLVIL